MKRIWIMLAAVLLITTPVAAQSPTTPYPGPARIIGSDSAGCIAGAVRLPDTAPGMQTIRVSRSTFWGHPTVIAALQDLARRAQAAGLPDLYMNDISLPRGGPLVGIHASHQRGVDADVWLDVAGPHPVLPIAQRETITPHTLVRPDGRGVDMTIWRPEHITLIRLAATEPGIDRVLVNPAIKQQLCTQVTGERSWLRRVRPWYGHATHMHLHFKCPAGQTECIDQPPPPEGDGCDASLAWWFEQRDKPAAKTSEAAPKPKPIVLPAACRAIMAAP
ncbi:MAG: penicillin-insensitive murein endopeptidase [Acetobacteraceae bacterium]|nr:penicillin-insensitive murein endopeptidase [Acetobacteraceae bacterium]